MSVLQMALWLSCSLAEFCVNYCSAAVETINLLLEITHRKRLIFFNSAITGNLNMFRARFFVLF